MIMIGDGMPPARREEPTLSRRPVPSDEDKAECMAWVEHLRLSVSPLRPTRAWTAKLWDGEDRAYSHLGLKAAVQDVVQRWWELSQRRRVSQNALARKFGVADADDVEEEPDVLEVDPDDVDDLARLYDALESDQLSLEFVGTPWSPAWTLKDRVDLDLETGISVLEIASRHGRGSEDVEATAVQADDSFNPARAPLLFHHTGATTLRHEMTHHVSGYRTLEVPPGFSLHDDGEGSFRVVPDEESPPWWRRVLEGKPRDVFLEHLPQFVILAALLLGFLVVLLVGRV